MKCKWLLRAGDEVALMFAMMARVSGPTFKTSLEQVARSVGIVQDYRHAEVRPGPTHTTGPHHQPTEATNPTLPTPLPTTLPHSHYMFALRRLHATTLNIISL